jgi:hypothetical protein
VQVPFGTKAQYCELDRPLGGRLDLQDELDGGLRPSETGCLVGSCSFIAKCLLPAFGDELDVELSLVERPATS